MFQYDEMKKLVLAVTYLTTIPILTTPQKLWRQRYFDCEFANERATISGRCHCRFFATQVAREVRRSSPIDPPNGFGWE